MKCGNVFIAHYPSSKQKFCSNECAGNKKGPLANRKCRGCGVEFSVPSSNKGKKYCTKICYQENRGKKIKSTCAVCSSVYYVHPFRADIAKFCSVPCFRLSTRSSVVLICKTCKEEFSVYPSVNKRDNPSFCSQACFGRSRRTSVEVPCEKCGRFFVVQPHRINNNTVKYCSKSCQDEARMIYSNKGLSDVPKNRRHQERRRRQLSAINQKTKLTKEVRDSVFEAGDWRCHYCDVRVKKTKKLCRTTATIDHIVAVANGGDNRMDNLITACLSCNSRKNAKPYAEYMASIGRLPLATEQGLQNSEQRGIDEIDS